MKKDNLGMWLFLASEILIFGVLIFLFQLTYFSNIADFKSASHDLHFYHGTFNTVVLLTSSYFVALSEHTHRRFFLLLAIALGFVFLGVKGYEYYDLTMEGKFPLHFLPMAKGKILFFSYYGFMTFLHLIHVLIGMSFLAYAWYEKEDHKLQQNVGLYWHFVDIVWVFLYPLFYLLGH
jgi:cytochrome c oxidase subunit III